jgi:hypothetical protein
VRNFGKKVNFSEKHNFTKYYTFQEIDDFPRISQSDVAHYLRYGECGEGRGGGRDSRQRLTGQPE